MHGVAQFAIQDAAVGNVIARLVPMFTATPSAFVDQCPDLEQEVLQKILNL